MFKGFRLDSGFQLSTLNRTRRRRTSGTNNLTAVEQMIKSGRPLDAAEVANQLFPSGSPDVFLSHSFNDREDVSRLANAIEELGLQVFVDSEVWESVYDLLRRVDDEYCRQPESTTYYYSKRNHSTANVYMILNSALHHMIDRSEVFIFVGSENSLIASTSDTTQSSPDRQKTCSPWIHSELTISSMIRRVEPKRFRKKFIDKSEASMEHLEERKLTVHHPAPVDHLLDLGDETLNIWLSSTRHQGDSALDFLYKLTGF